MKDKKSNKYFIIHNKFSAIFILIIIVVVVILGVNISKRNNQNRLTINTKTSLEKILEISKLSTIEYTYNAIVTKYKNDIEKSSNIEYYVSYEGKVRAGIDFNEVGIKVDDKSKKVVITLPDVEVIETSVDMGTLDFIYVKKISEGSSISQEAYKLCKKDLKERASKEDELTSIARSNAESVIEGMIKPWFDTVDNKYKVEFK